MRTRPATEEAARARRVLDWGKSTAQATQAKAKGHLDAHRHRAPVELAIRMLGEGDRDAAGRFAARQCRSPSASSSSSSRCCFALVGLAGFVGATRGEPDPEDAGITGNMAQQINTALTQPNSTRWIATILGLFGMALGRPHPEQGAQHGELHGVGDASSTQQGLGPGDRRDHRARRRHRARGRPVVPAHPAARLGVGGGQHLVRSPPMWRSTQVAWLLLFLMLPRRDRGSRAPPSPAQSSWAATLAGMQAVSQLYLPGPLQQGVGALRGRRRDDRDARLVLHYGPGHGAQPHAQRRDLRAVREHLRRRLRPTGPPPHPAALAEVAHFFELDVDPETPAWVRTRRRLSEPVPDATDERPLG